MKIEKINDKQIRCVLTKEDLEDRKIRLSELVCGGEKARSLLRDMLLRASRELGFSFNNNPMMIEAVPTGKDQLVLILTRVDDPGELDARFRDLSGKTEPAGTDSVREEKAGKDAEDWKNAPARFYLFRSLENVLNAAKCLPQTYPGENTLYKNPEDGAYYLLIKRPDSDQEQYDRICSALSEYSMPMDYTTGMDEFFREHMQVMIEDRAMQNLRSV